MFGTISISDVLLCSTTTVPAVKKEKITQRIDGPAPYRAHSPLFGRRQPYVPLVDYRTRIYIEVPVVNPRKNIFMVGLKYVRMVFTRLE